MEHAQPPEGWRQRAGRSVPFPPGRAGEEWETIIASPPGHASQRYDLNCSSLEVYQAERGRWHQPTWGALPELVRLRIWHHHPRTLTPAEAS